MSKLTQPNIATGSVAEAIRPSRRGRWNSLRSLTPLTLTTALDAFEFGDLHSFAVLAETVAERDDTIKGVKPKREKAIAARARTWIVIPADESREAKAHQAVLTDFWKTARAGNAYDRNERGGLAQIIRRMMGAVSFRYAVHHIVWSSKGGKIRATFEFVPLWFFENKTGCLRFVATGTGGQDGEELAEGEWMITVGDGLMIAALISYLAKRYSLQDWLAFSEKFSMPGTLGITPHGKDTEEGRAMKAAIESFSQDWSAVLYGTEPSDKDPIRLIQPDGNPAAMPMPALIERIDQRLAGMWRGADLSSMSSTSGEGRGASLQQKEKAILEADDCEMIAETLRGVERHPRIAPACSNARLRHRCSTRCFKNRSSRSRPPKRGSSFPPREISTRSPRRISDSGSSIARRKRSTKGRSSNITSRSCPACGSRG